MFDVIIVTETWLTDKDNVDLYLLEGYCVEFNHRKFNKRGGGIAIYTRNHIKYKLCNDLCISDENFMESLCLELMFHNKLTIKIIGIYKAPLIKMKDFNDKLELFLDNTNASKTYIIGDFNIDLLTHQIDNHVKDFVNLMYLHSFQPIINRPTRITESSATLIDNIWTNSVINNKYNYGILISDLSDHFPIYSIENLNIKNFTCQKHKIKRNFCLSNVNKLITDLDNLNWQNVLNTHDVDGAFNLFYDIFISALNKACPLVEQKISNKNGLNSKWISNKLKNACLKKNILYKKYINCPNVSIKQRYVTYRNKIKKYIRNSESKYYTNKLLNSNDMKQTWLIIKEVLKQNNSHHGIDTITRNGQVFNDKMNISNVFNEHY
jgi:hypothetical protein